MLPNLRAPIAVLDYENHVWIRTGVALLPIGMGVSMRVGTDVEIRMGVRMEVLLRIVMGVRLTIWMGG